jgi:membrane associated rhomboid family serine protease/Tfp pilus assembly protein PilF
MRKRSWPLLTLILTAILAAIYAGERWVSLSEDGSADPVALYSLGSLSSVLVLQSGEWFRLVSSTLMHVNGIHLIANIIGLLLAGRYLEPLIGRGWFWAVFGLCGAAGSLGSLFWNTQIYHSVGASGAIAGLFTCALVCSFRRFAWRRVWVQIVLIIWIAISIVPFSSDHLGFRVDDAGHFGGAAMGLAVGGLIFALWPKDRVRPNARAGMICAALITIIYAGALASFAEHYNQAIPLYRANAYTRKGEFRSASGEYSKAIERDPSNASLFFARADAFAQDGEIDKAISDYTMATQLMPGNAQFHLALGRAYSALGNQAQAESQAALVLQREPENVEAHRLRTIVLTRLGQHEQALANLDQVVRRSPSDPDNYNSRAMILISLKRLPEALDNANKALAMSPASPAFRDTRGQIFLGLGKPKEALDDFNATLRSGKLYPVSLLGRGDALEKLGFPKLAIIDYQAALKVNPEDVEDRQAQDDALKRLEALEHKN